MRRFRALCASALCALVPVCWIAAPAAAASAYRDQVSFAWQMYRQELYEPAAFAFQEALAMSPGRGEALYGLALSYERLGRYDEAAEKILAAEAAPDAPATVDFAWSAARVLEAAGRLAEARTRYRRLALEGPPEQRVEARFREGVVLLKMNRFAEAEEVFASIVEKAPRSELVPDARYNVGLARYRRGDPDGAADLLTAVLTNHPKSHAAYDAAFLLGEIFRARRSYEVADEYYARAIALAEELGIVDGRAPYHRAYALFEAGREEAALPLFRKVAEDPKAGRWGAEAAAFVAARLLSEAKFIEAARLLEPYLRTEGAAGRKVRLLAAKIEIEEERFETAERRLRALVEECRAAGSEAADVFAEAAGLLAELTAKKAPASADALLEEALSAAASDTERRRALVLARARLHLSLGNFERADAIARAEGKALALPYALARATALEEAGRIEEAIGTLRAVEPTPHYALGVLLYRSGRYETAAMHLAEADSAGLAPAGEAAYWLGWARYQAGDFAGAEEAFLRAAEFPRRAAEALRRAADAAYNRGAYDVAASRYEVAARGAEGDLRAELLYARAEALFHLGEVDSAVALLDASAGAAEDSSIARDAKFRAAQFLKDVGRAAEAAARFDDFAKDRPGDPRAFQARFLAGEAWAAAGETALARDRYLALREANAPNAAAAVEALAALTEREGDVEGALALYDEAAEQAASSVVGRRARIRAAWLRLRGGDAAAAAASMGDLLEGLSPADPLYGDAAAARAEALERLGESSARAWYETAVVYIPPSCRQAALRLHLGKRYLAEDNPRAARRHLEFVYRSADLVDCPQRAQAGCALAEALSALGADDAARRVREEAACGEEVGE